MIALSGVGKEARKIGVGNFKPVESVFGKNGSKAAGFVTKWGLIGSMDRALGRTHLDRIKLEAQK
jgi:hypothetical protein